MESSQIVVSVPEIGRTNKCKLMCESGKKYISDSKLQEFFEIDNELSKQYKKHHRLSNRYNELARVYKKQGLMEKARVMKENANKEYYKFHELRFDVLHDKVFKNFVLENVHTINDLLYYGRKMLERYLEDSRKNKAVDSPTSIESSIVSGGEWPLIQMIELNKYMYTTYSTNRPNDITSEMSVEGYIPNCIRKVLAKKLDEYGYSYRMVELWECVHKKIDSRRKGVVTKGLSEDMWGLDNNCTVEPTGVEHKPLIVNNMTQLLVEDPVKERRDLYVNLIKIFRGIYRCDVEYDDN